MLTDTLFSVKEVPATYSFNEEADWLAAKPASVVCEAEFTTKYCGK